VFLATESCEAQHAYSETATCYLVDGRMLYYVSSLDDISNASNEIASQVQIMMDKGMLLEDPILGVYWIGVEDAFENLIVDPPSNEKTKETLYKHMLWIGLSVGGFAGLSILAALSKRKPDEDSQISEFGEDAGSESGAKSYTDILIIPSSSSDSKVGTQIKNNNCEGTRFDLLQILMS